VHDTRELVVRRLHKVTVPDGRRAQRHEADVAGERGGQAQRNDPRGHAAGTVPDALNERLGAGARGTRQASAALNVRDAVGHEDVRLGAYPSVNPDAPVHVDRAAAHLDRESLQVARDVNDLVRPSHAQDDVVAVTHNVGLHAGARWIKVTRRDDGGGYPRHEVFHAVVSAALASVITPDQVRTPVREERVS